MSAGSAVNEAFVAAENINALLEQGGVTGEIDFLSIDIDNNDYWVWKAISGDPAAGGRDRI